MSRKVINEAERAFYLDVLGIETDSDIWILGKKEYKIEMFIAEKIEKKECSLRSNILRLGQHKDVHIAVMKQKRFEKWITLSTFLSNCSAIGPSAASDAQGILYQLCANLVGLNQSAVFRYEDLTADQVLVRKMSSVECIIASQISSGIVRSEMRFKNHARVYLKGDDAADIRGFALDLVRLASLAASPERKTTPSFVASAPYRDLSSAELPEGVVEIPAQWSMIDDLNLAELIAVAMNIPTDFPKKLFAIAYIEAMAERDLEIAEAVEKSKLLFSETPIKDAVDFVLLDGVSSDSYYGKIVSRAIHGDFARLINAASIGLGAMLFLRNPSYLCSLLRSAPGHSGFNAEALVSAAMKIPYSLTGRQLYSAIIRNGTFARFMAFPVRCDNVSIYLS